MNQQQAKEIIENEPVGGAHYYAHGYYLTKYNGQLFVYYEQDGWVKINFKLDHDELITMTDILAIAIGEEK